MGKEATRVRKRERKNIASGVAHVNASFNNTMITITDVQGNTIAWSSSGTMGFKGSLYQHFESAERYIAIASTSAALAAAGHHRDPGVRPVREGVLETVGSTTTFPK